MSPSARITRALDALEVAPGQRVGLFVAFGDLAHAARAVMDRGAVAVPLALRLGVEPLAYHLRDAEASALVVRAEHVELARAAMTRAPTCVHLVVLDALEMLESETPFDSATASAFDEGDAAFLSYAPESRGGRPRGLIHDHRALGAALEGTAEALDLRADDEVAIEVPLWEGALVLGLAAHARGATIVERAGPGTSAIAVRARDAVARLAELHAHAPRLRAALSIGSGRFGASAARELAARHDAVEIASAQVIRELPIWLSVDVLARSEAAPRRLGSGSLRGVSQRLENDGRIAVTGDAIPRAYFRAPDETQARIELGWLVSEDHGEAHADTQLKPSSAATDRAAIDVLDAHLVPREASAAHLAQVRRRTIVYPLGRGRGASIALDAGLKPMLRELIAVPELDRTRARFEAAGWLVEISPIVFGPTHDGWLGRPESRTGTTRSADLDRRPVFVGRDRALLLRAIECERAHTLDGARELGALLGYPPCCVDAFVGHIEDRRAVRLWASAAARTPPESFAARLNVLDPSTFTYVSWFPCRFDCAPSIALADALADRIARDHGDFVRAIDHALGAPRLVLAPEVQLRLDPDASARPRVASTRTHADPRAPEAREDSIAARALESLEGAKTIDVRGTALVIDGMPAPIPFDAPLPLLLPFGVRESAREVRDVEQVT